MPILKSAINAYLNEPRDDHRWLKKLTEQEINGIIAELDPQPDLWPKMRLHQKVSFLLGVLYESFSFWLDMGSGKTLVALELIRYWHKCGRLKRAIVFVISDKAFLTWERQIKKFKFDLPYVTLEGSSQEKWDKLSELKHGLIIAAYPGAVAMCSVKGKKGKRKKSGFILVPELVDKLGAGASTLVMDESTKIGNTQSLVHKMCARIGKRAPYRYALAGLPFGRDPLMLYSQQKVVDRGASFVNKGLFQEAFYSKQKNQWGKSKYSFEYIFKKSMTDELSRMMQHRSITYEEHEWGGALRIQYIKDPVRFSKESQAYYVEVAKQLIKSRGNYTETKNLFLRLRQITSGFIGFKDDETGEKASLAFSTNPKLEHLIEQLGSLDTSRKAVVFYEYTWSGRQIVEHIKKFLGEPTIWLWSGTQDPRKEIQTFLDSPKHRIAVINNKVGAYSLDGLQEVANYMFIYESPVSPIDRAQLEKRLKRSGQKRRVYVYDLIVPGSVDERILEFHKEGRDLMAAVRKDPASVLQPRK